MKNKIQEKSEPKILEAEIIFVISFQSADVLFVKPKAEKAMALKLPKIFLKNLMLKFEPKI